jgi:uncharacterized protein RhaS with RHS repeats
VLLPGLPTPAPTNLTTQIAYDREGTQASTTDARGNVTSRSWSATRKLLSTILPAMSAGTPVATDLRTATFGYDGDSRKIATNNGAAEVTSETWDTRSELIDLIVSFRGSKFPTPETVVS